jgi:hypothetical protein
MTGFAAVITSIHKGVVLFGFPYSLLASREQSQIFSIVGDWHIRASFDMHFMIPIWLGIFVNVILFHDPSILVIPNVGAVLNFILRETVRVDGAV